MKKDSTTSASGKTGRPPRVNVKEVGNRIDSLLESEMQPLAGAVHRLRDKFLAGLALGYSISELIAMAQDAGINASDSQLRRAFASAGICKKRTRRGAGRGGSKQPSGQRDGARDANEAPQVSALSGSADQQDIGCDVMDAPQDCTGCNGMSSENSILHDAAVDTNGIQPRHDNGVYDAVVDVQPGIASGASESQDAPGSGGDAAQAGTMDSQARRSAWTPRIGALNALSNTDTKKLNRYQKLEDRRGRP